jgi:hypothetical protein
MFLKIKSLTKQINQLVLIGLVASLAWIGGATFIYFNEIANHRKYRGSHLREYFSWEIYNKKTLNKEVYIDYRDAEEIAESQQSSSGWRGIPQPIFNFIGYLSFILMPIALGWLFTCLMILLYSRNMFLNAWNRFKSSDLIAKSVLIGVASYLLLLWRNDGDISSTVSYLIYTYVLTPLLLLGLYYLSRGLWFCIKAAIYGIFYAATKAIDDARAQK